MFCSKGGTHLMPLGLPAAPAPSTRSRRLTSSAGGHSEGGGGKAENTSRHWDSLIAWSADMQQDQLVRGSGNDGREAEGQPLRIASRRLVHEQSGAVDIAAQGRVELAVSDSGWNP